ncbi:hypothetical protein M405DRAFT_692092, partial [Rhizopogon salebrosus TDB-379]
CQYCSALLLKGENNSFCCNNGACITPRLPPLPPHIRNILSSPTLSRNLSQLSRRLNNLFSFTAIGSSKGFAHFHQGISSVAITGRTYHRIFDVSKQDHSFYWFLYDETERESHGNTFDIPTEWTQALRADLHTYNPY